MAHEHPFPAVEPIAERLSFYPEKLEVYERRRGEVNPHREQRRTGRGSVLEGEEGLRITVDDVVQQTDGLRRPQKGIARQKWESRSWISANLEYRPKSDIFV